MTLGIETLATVTLGDISAASSRGFTGSVTLSEYGVVYSESLAVITNITGSTTSLLITLNIYANEANYFAGLAPVATQVEELLVANLITESDFVASLYASLINSIPQYAGFTVI